jgi:peroxiredoxin
MYRIFSIALLALGVSVAHAAEIAPAAEAVTPVLVGSHIPAVSVHTLEGKPTSLESAVGGKPTVLVFYRGSWCPFCNLQLSQLNAAQDQLIALGYQIIAVTPDQPADIRKTLDKNKLSYTIYSDSDFAAIKAFGVGYRVPAEIVEKSRGYGVTLPQLPDRSGAGLPVPAVFILDAKGVVQFAYVNPDYRIRLSSELLLTAARTSLAVKPLQPPTQ